MFKCEICGKEEVVKNRSLSFDHNHKTNSFRGMLCYKCNIQLGWFELNSEKILEYTKR